MLGKHSGRHAFRVRLNELGYDLSDEDLNKAFQRFKVLADKKKTITDADLEALIADEVYQPREIYHPRWASSSLRHDGDAHCHRAVAQPGWPAVYPGRGRHGSGGCHLQSDGCHRHSPRTPCWSSPCMPSQRGSTPLAR